MKKALLILISLGAIIAQAQTYNPFSTGSLYNLNHDTGVYISNTIRVIDSSIVDPNTKYLNRGVIDVPGTKGKRKIIGRNVIADSLSVGKDFTILYRDGRPYSISDNQKVGDTLVNYSKDSSWVYLESQLPMNLWMTTPVQVRKYVFSYGDTLWVGDSFGLVKSIIENEKYEIAGIEGKLNGGDARFSKQDTISNFEICTENSWIHTGDQTGQTKTSHIKVKNSYRQSNGRALRGETWMRIAPYSGPHSYLYFIDNINLAEDDKAFKEGIYPGEPILNSLGNHHFRESYHTDSVYVLYGYIQDTGKPRFLLMNNPNTGHVHHGFFELKNDTLTLSYTSNNLFYNMDIDLFDRVYYGFEHIDRFSITGYDLNGYQYGSLCEHIISLDLSEQSTKLIVFYPNPTSNELRFIGDGEWSYEIYNVQGHLCMVGHLKENVSIDVRGLSSGSYFIQGSNKEGKHFNKLFIKQ